jgi:hypothetical protein
VCFKTPLNVFKTPFVCFKTPFECVLDSMHTAALCLHHDNGPSPAPSLICAPVGWHLSCFQYLVSANNTVCTVSKSHCAHGTFSLGCRNRLNCVYSKVVLWLLDLQYLRAWLYLEVGLERGHWG